METIEEKEYNKIQWFLFVVIIPILFTVVLSLVLMQVAGINVFSHAKAIVQKIPGVSMMIKDENAIAQEKLEEKLSNEIANLQTDINHKDDTIEKLEASIQSKESELTTLKQELSQLNFQLAEMKEDKIIEENAVKDMTELYELMTPKKAAQIIPNLDDEDAKKILTSLKTDKLAAIMEKMSPEDAAKYTKIIGE
ncbi:MotE family protein [Litchfieldia alkalitelluris]|uniref:MotE family protein n=1 Tax=Litchfieldia alkalitelluris TaxID=304268 RepID=UPI000997B3F2|nr:hypothetical protein [Litchfieldia alkalitelluris]